MYQVVVFLHHYDAFVVVFPESDRCVGARSSAADDYDIFVYHVLWRDIGFTPVCCGLGDYSGQSQKLRKHVVLSTCCSVHLGRSKWEMAVVVTH